MTIEEAEAWVGRSLTENETALVRFARKAIINGSERVLVFSAWGKVEPELLDAPIPAQVLIDVYGEDVGDVTLRDFALVEGVVVPEGGGAFALFSLSANYDILPAPKGRERITTADDVVQWLGLTASYGVTIDNILTDQERKDLLNSTEA